MYKEKIFEVKTRKEIYNYLIKNPGLHFREIVRSLNMPGSTLSYHLKYLEKRGFLLKEFENGYSRYYVSEKNGKNDKKLFNILREIVPRNIILFLCLSSNSSQTDMIKFAKAEVDYTRLVFFENNIKEIGAQINEIYRQSHFDQDDEKEQKR